MTGFPAGALGEGVNITGGGVSAGCADEEGLAPGAEPETAWAPQADKVNTENAVSRKTRVFFQV